MTDDFRLFSDPNDSQGDSDSDSADADTALISAYLARELTLVQIVAVEERLATDQAFRAHAAPTIAAWTLPRSYGRVAPKELPGSAGLEAVAPSTSQFIGAKSLLRVAAVVAAFSLPVAGLAHAVSYVASHPELPGNEIARRIIAPFRKEAPQQRAIPARTLGPAVLTSAPIAGEARQARVLPDGRVLVNDIVRREIFVLDSSLANPVTVFDSIGATSLRYGAVRRRPIRTFFPTFFGFRGDTTLFLSYDSRKIGFLDPALQFVRTDTTMSVLIWSPALQLRDGSERWAPSFGILSRHDRPQPGDCASVTTTEAQCGGLIVAFNPDTKATDTLAALYAPEDLGRFGETSDHWAVVTDGAIAILRARAYLVEWINPDLSRTVGPRIPHDWRMLDLRTRTRMADSINTVRRQNYDANLILWALDSADVVNGRPWNPRLPIRGGGGAAPMPMPVDTARGRGRGGGQGAAAITGGRGAPPPPGTLPAPTGWRVVLGERISDGRGNVINRPRPADVIGPDAFPDSLPPVDRAVNALLPDLDNRLWIRSEAWVTPPGAPTRYDIVNRAGELVDRIDVPSDRTVIGFGAGGVVILAAQSGGVYTLEKVRFR